MSDAVIIRRLRFELRLARIRTTVACVVGLGVL